jgi:hypothetical protein
VVAQKHGGSSKPQTLHNKLAAQAERHKCRMIKRHVNKGYEVPLHWLSPAYWWMARCGWVTKELAPHFDEIWKWWQSLDVTAQYTLMRYSRRFGTV